MSVWSLITASNYTTFYFPLQEDKVFFHEIVKNYFEKSKKAEQNWRPLYMLRGEPMKHPDFFEIDNTDIVAISQKAVDSLLPFLNKQIELLQIETDAGRYYALNVLNFVDCLDQEKSVYTATKDGTIVSYSSLEFDKSKLGSNAIFKISQLPYMTFCSDDIQEQCEELNLPGLVFDIETNLVWYPE
ncbi:MAG: DUF1629 domain-containing protein [Ginsengibacter sp.]